MLQDKYRAPPSMQQRQVYMSQKNILSFLISNDFYNYLFKYNYKNKKINPNKTQKQTSQHTVKQHIMSKSQKEKLEEKKTDKGIRCYM